MIRESPNRSDVCHAEIYFKLNLNVVYYFTFAHEVKVYTYMSTSDKTKHIHIDIIVKYGHVMWYDNEPYL